MTELPLPKINTQNEIIENTPSTPIELSEDKLTHILTNVVVNHIVSVFSI